MDSLCQVLERDLARIAAAVARKRQPLRGKAEIGLEIGAVLDKHKMAKHLEITIGDADLAFARACPWLDRGQARRHVDLEGDAGERQRVEIDRIANFATP